MTKIAASSPAEAMQLLAEHLESRVHDIEIRQAALELVIARALHDLANRGSLPDLFVRSMGDLQRMIAEGNEDKKAELVAAIEHIKRMVTGKR